MFNAEQLYNAMCNPITLSADTISNIEQLQSYASSEHDDVADTMLYGIIVLEKLFTKKQ